MSKKNRTFVLDFDEKVSNTDPETRNTEQK